MDQLRFAQVRRQNFPVFQLYEPLCCYVLGKTCKTTSRLLPATSLRCRRSAWAGSRYDAGWRLLLLTFWAEVRIACFVPSQFQTVKVFIGKNIESIQHIHVAGITKLSSLLTDISCSSPSLWWSCAQVACIILTEKNGWTSVYALPLAFDDGRRTHSYSCVPWT